jgi:sensor histidine kinase YesM
MPFGIDIPKYTNKDTYVLVGTMIPLGITINSILYGGTYFSKWSVFAGASLATFFFMALAFFIYGLVAISLRQRLPEDKYLYRRIAICIPLFLLMSVVYISLMLRTYDFIELFGYEYSERDFLHVYLTFAVINIFLTFLNEGIYQFERYRTTATETEQLKKEYMQSQLLGLKSQMNPHFLFNSLNTLSSLIHEEGDHAEDFLNHMSKVYRYLLRNNEEQLVTIETELSFIRSYYYLLRSRHTDSLQIDINVAAEVREMMLPPLTLQMIVENATNRNTMSKADPLHISIESDNDYLIIKNSVKKKINGEEEDVVAMANIYNKYKLLCGDTPKIKNNNNERVIRLPFIPNPEMITA